jgi:hypothetical protein
MTFSHFLVVSPNDIFSFSGCVLICIYIYKENGALLFCAFAKEDPLGGFRIKSQTDA